MRGAPEKRTILKLISVAKKKQLRHTTAGKFHILAVLKSTIKNLEEDLIRIRQLENKFGVITQKTSAQFTTSAGTNA